MDVGQAGQNYYDAIRTREITSKSVDKLILQRKLQGLRFARPYTRKQIDTDVVSLRMNFNGNYVAQILATVDLLFLLWIDGSCLVLSKGSYREICQFRGVQELIYNEQESTLIIVQTSGWTSAYYRKFTFVSSPIEYVRDGDPMNGHLFQSYPSITYYAFDVKNCRGTIHSEGAYRIFDLKSYAILYTIPDHYDSGRFPLSLSLQDNLMLLADARRDPPEARRARIICLQIYNKENGAKVMEKSVDLRNRRMIIRSITLCGDKIIIQPSLEYGGLRIVDLKNDDESVKLQDTNIFIHDKRSPIYLPDRHCFLGDRPVAWAMRRHRHDKNDDDHTHIRIGIWDLNKKLVGTPDWRIDIPFVTITPPQCSPLRRMSITPKRDLLLVYQEWFRIDPVLDIVDMNSRRILGRIQIGFRDLEYEYYDEHTHDIWGGVHDMHKGHVQRWRF